MVWKAKAKPTQAEVKRAIELLGSWRMGVIEETEHIQYRGDWHPNHDGPGKHHGVEVWTDIPQDQYGYKSPAVPMADFGTTSAEEKALVLAEGTKRGWPAEELDAAVYIESQWKPHIFNPASNASGLIQFMPFTLKGMGWTGTPEEFRKKTSAEQAPWVGAYFDYIGKKWKRPGDTYLAIAASRYVGASDDTVVYKQGSKAWEQNPLWRPADGGDITAGSIRAILLSRMGNVPTPAPANDEGYGGLVLGFLGVLGLGFLATRVRR